MEIRKDIITKFDGLLLGDGNIAKYPRYRHGSISKEWLENIKSWLLNNQINSKIYPTKRVLENKLYTGYEIYTRGKIELFKEIRERWYKKWYDIDLFPKRLWIQDEYGDYFVYRKIIPNDFDELSPECVADWYMGDGDFHIHKTHHEYQLKISTHNFTKEEVEYLTYLLNDQVIEGAYINKHMSGYVIRITRKKSVESFFDYIRPYIIPFFNYKILEVN